MNHSTCTTIVNDKKEELFREVVFHFTSQRSQLFLDSLRSSLLDPRYTDYQFTPFWDLHPEGRFVFKSLYNGFRKYLTSKTFDEHVDIEGLVNKIRKDTTEHLLHEMDNFTYGINIDHIIALSGEVYESRNASDLRFAVFPDVHSCPLGAALAVRFEDSITFSLENIHAIRKQLNLAPQSVLVVCFEGKTFNVKGVLSPKDKDRFPYFQFEKHLAWSFYMPSIGLREGIRNTTKSNSKCIIRYRQGSLMFPNIDLSFEIIEKLSALLKSERKVNNILKMIKMTDVCKHGAVLIISTPKVIKDEVERLSVIGKRGTYFKKSISVFRSRNVNQLSIFSEIDGAIFVDFNGQCPACGIILDGYFNSSSCRSGDRGRGSRFNSTQLYIDMFRGRNVSIIGIAKSEDGMLDIFTPNDPLIS